jgi:hypothetical protein
MKIDNNSIVIEESGNLSKDFLELGIDSLIDDGVLKDIPIVGSLFSITKLTIAIKDKILLKKISYFLFELNSISENKRLEFIDKLQNDESYGEKVGEKLLLIIDKINDYSKSKFIGKLFAATIKEKIDYNTFLKLSNIIDRCFCNDLYKLKLINELKYDEYNEDDIDEFYNLGLLKNEGIYGDFFIYNDDEDVPNIKSEFKINKYGKIIIELLLQ